MAAEPVDVPKGDVGRGNDEPSRFLRFFSNPKLGIAGSVASIISVPLAIYFAVTGVTYPDLVYLTVPNRAAIVRQGATSRLSVQFDGQLMGKDVTAVQIAVWNAGRSAIRPSAVLQPVAIHAAAGTEVLEASIRNSTRAVIQPQIVMDREVRDEVGISWAILEQGDGVLIQIIYAGGPDIPFRVEGVLEGQKEIRQVKYPWDPEQGTSVGLGELRRRTIMAMIGGTCFGAFAIAFMLYKSRREEGREGRVWVGLAIIYGCGILWILKELGAVWNSPAPPFGI